MSDGDPKRILTKIDDDHYYSFVQHTHDYVELSPEEISRDHPRSTGPLFRAAPDAEYHVCGISEYHRPGPDFTEQFRAYVEDAGLEGDWCAGFVSWCAGPRGRPDHLWTLESLDPLTLSPSILCQCGMHGFIRDGKWVTA